MILSVPSYVIPGTYAENLRFLSDKEEIQGVELLFFFYDEEVRALLDREQEEIESFQRRFRFTLHMPDTVAPSHEELVQRTRRWVTHYVLHPPRNDDSPSLKTFLPGWIQRYGNLFLLENTRWEAFERALDELPDIPLCCDTGHLLLEGLDPAWFLERYGERAREIHLHGSKDGQDHQGFAAEEEWFQRLVPYLRAFPGVVNLEVFSYPDVKALEQTLRFALGAVPGVGRGVGGRGETAGN